MSLVISKKRKGRILPAIVDDFFSMSSFFESSLLDFKRGFLSEHNFPIPDTSIIENVKDDQIQLAESGSGQDDLNKEVEKKARKRKS